LQRLRDSLPELKAIIDELRLELVDDPAWAEPSDTSYLNDADRANPEIMDNVAAMAATDELIAWFGRDFEGYVGLWRGPSQRPLARAPVVRLDTEGQYALVAATVPDYIAMGMSRDGFERRRAALVEAGFDVGSSPDVIWAALEPFDDPNAYRGKLYNEGRKRRGLEPI
jgi:hypothetical protein